MGWKGYETAVKKDPYGVAYVLDIANRLSHTQGRRAMSPTLEHELAHVIERESSWRPENQNMISGKPGATGLIQFMPETAKMLGTTIDDLKLMDLEMQAEYVEKYFAKVLATTGSLDKPGDLYMATFWPAGMAMGPDDVIADKDGPNVKVWLQNPGLRCTKDGPITAGCVRAWGTPTSFPATPFPQLAQLDSPHPVKKIEPPLGAIALVILAVLIIKGL